MEMLKMLSANELVAQLVSFLILFFILKALAWKRVLKLLDDRKEKISLEFKRMEDQKREAEKAKAEFEQKLKNIEDVSRAKIQDMMSDAQKAVQEIKNDAQRQAAQIIAKAEANTRYELVKAKEELKDEIANLVLDATEHLLEEKITEAKDKKIVNDFLERVDKV